MEDIALSDVGRKALGIAREVALHSGGDTVMIDVSAVAGWTDFFVIATTTSSAHMAGLFRRVEEIARAADLSRLNNPRLADDEEWCLVDYGDIVVHLMSERARLFYDLEKHWFQGRLERIEAPLAPRK